MTINLVRRKKQPPPTFMGHYAGFISRLVAFTIDILIVSITIGVLLGLIRLILTFFNIDPLILKLDTGGTSTLFRYVLLFMTSFTFTFLVNMVYCTFFWMAAGKTIGKAVMGLQVIGPKGSRITFWRAIKRYTGYWISALPFFLGYFWVLINDSRQGWHDIIAGTSVIYDHDAQYSEQLLGRLARFVPRIENKVSEDEDNKLLLTGEAQPEQQEEAQRALVKEVKE